MQRAGKLGVLLLCVATADAFSQVPPGQTDTEIPEYLQIDDLPSTQGDANLFLGPHLTGGPGNDPADGTLNANFPAGPPGATYLDWNDLGGPADIDNHRFLDLNGPGGKDASAFPQSNECVGSTNVLSKMDLTYVASANNRDYAYFAVQRSDNNGDAGWYWLFTRRAPLEIPGQMPCKPDQRRLLYNISGPNGGTGDVLVVGHFKPSANEPLVKVYQAKTSRNNVTAVHAINFADTTLWGEVVGAVAASAVNTTITDPGRFGRAGVIALTKNPPTNMLLPGVFAEAAINLDVFTGQEACGVTFYGSVITRSSGSGGANPDLKDLAGRLVFNFSEITASAELSPSCQQEFSYVASDENGQPLSDEDYTCQWTVKDSEGQVVGVPTGCAGTFAPLQEGTYSATVEVMTNALNCLRSVDAGSVEVRASIGEVAAALSGSCDSSLGYAATVGSGEENVTFAWGFSPEIPGASATDQSGTLTEVPAGTYTATVTVTQDRTDGLVCQKATTSDPASVFAPVVAEAQVTPSCQQEFGFNASATAGGGGGFSCVWSLTDGTTLSTECSGTHQPPPGTYAGNVTVTDGQTGCSDTIAFGPVNVYPELSGMTANLIGSSNNTLSYAASVSGGSGSYGFVWTFNPELSPVPTDQSGTLENVPAGTYTSTVNVVDNRTDLTCEGSATSNSATVFVPVVAEAQVTPSCQQEFGFAASATGGGGGEYSCVWAFADGTILSNECSGTYTGEPGTYAGHVTVTDAQSGGSDDAAFGPVNVYPPLSGATATLTGSSNNTLSYAATASGGSGSYGFAWTFTPDLPPSVPVPTDQSGTLENVPAGTYTATVTVVDNRTDQVCELPATSDPARVEDPAPE